MPRLANILDDECPSETDGPCARCQLIHIVVHTSDSDSDSAQDHNAAEPALDEIDGLARVFERAITLELAARPNHPDDTLYTAQGRATRH